MQPRATPSPPRLHGLRGRGRRLAGLVAAIVIAAACSPAVSSPTPGTSGAPTQGPTAAADCSELSFLAAEYTTATLPHWQQLIKDFEEANPGVTVNLQVSGFQFLHDLIAQRIGVGKPPDVIHTATIWLAEWVKAGAVEPIDSVFDTAFLDTFDQNALKNGALFDGKTWGLPVALGVRQFYYNKDLLRQAGLDPERPPRTWDELKSFAVQIKKRTGKFGYAWDGKGVEVFRNFGYYLWNHNPPGDYFNADGTAAWNSSAGIETLTFLTELIATGAVPDPTGILVREELQGLMKSGELAMGITGSWFVKDLVAAGIDFGVADIPTQDAGMESTPWGVTDTMFISSASPCKELAANFVKMMFEPERRLTFNKNDGLAPELTANASDPAFAQPPQFKPFVDRLPAARFDQLVPTYNRMMEELRTQIQLAYKGDLTPEKALNIAAENYNAAVGR
jgi:multiple sugar transport system substrate-binding protein